MTTIVEAVLALRGTVNDEHAIDVQLDREKLRLVMKHIDANPFSHDQTRWGVRILDGDIDMGILTEAEQDEAVQNATACRTAFCFAGWTAELDGCEMRWSYDPLEGDGDLAEVLPAGERQWEAPGFYAKRALGLPGGWADQLFAATNSRQTLHAMIDYLCDEVTDGPYTFGEVAAVIERLDQIARANDDR